ncbi:SDR family NAD(P)-dependent oxidoreductase [Microbispora siamensis]
MGDGRLAGRTAIITGAGDGIGRGVARRFAAEGAKVLVAEIDEESGTRTARELAAEFGADARFVHTDVTDRARARRWSRPGRGGGSTSWSTTPGAA